MIWYTYKIIVRKDECINGLLYTIQNVQYTYHKLCVMV